ncbi:MAG: glycosyltransferase family 9 protein [Candidatus Omnitrophica bacterium]|nr:glycosyltransferase family 9 protein [Candidatus Omnitrophota bacterium]
MKILIVNPFGIGDVLFTTPILNALAESGHSVYYWSNERVADILKYNPKIKGVFSLARGDIKKIFKDSFFSGIKSLFSMLVKIKKEKFDVAFDFSLDYRHSLILWFLGVKKRIGFDYKNRGRFLTDAIKVKGFGGQHMVEYYNGLARFMGSSIKPDVNMELFVGKDDVKQAEVFLQKCGVAAGDILLGIAPGGGGSWGKDAFRKRWPKEKFAYIAERLGKEASYKIVIFGSKDESDICAYVNKNTSPKAIDACGKLTLGQYAAVLKRCRLLVTNDGGPLHMAVALEVPSVSIFGPVDEKVYGPYPESSKHAVISGEAKCRPCYKDFRYPLCKAFICFDSIEPERVLKTVKRFL